MKKFLFCSFLTILFSCGEKNTTVITANLSDLEKGQVIIYKPEDTNTLKFNGVVISDSGKYFVSELTNKYELFDFETGHKVFSFQIPRDGPNAMKGSMNGAAIISASEYAVFNQNGEFHSYENGNLSQALQVNLSEITGGKFTQISKETGNLIKTGEGKYQVVLNPFDLMNPNGGFETTFSAWIIQMDTEKGVRCVSDFKSPYDESFYDSPSATLSLGAKNFDRDEYWYMFALSDSIYRIEDCKIVQRLKLDNLGDNSYHPDLVTRNGRNAQWNANPKSHRNIKLFYDKKTNQYFRIVKLPNKLDEDEVMAMDVRTISKMKADYQILIYDFQWDLNFVINFTVPVGNNLESCFMHEGILYLNQPDQENEDEYVLIKYDLSNL